MRFTISLATALLGFLVSGVAGAQPATFLAGADISALPSLEQAGAVYRDAGKAGDALAILRAHGCNLFRVRLFVDPNPSFARSGGAVQNLDYVIALAKRIKASGALFDLDFHYSDSWADPGHQPTPAAWASLDHAAMERKVHDYTADVLAKCGAAGVMPEMVQIGNEITAGILWPTGQLYPPRGKDDEQWQEFARLLNAGAKAVREESAAMKQPIRIVLHVDRGGRDAPVWFFHKLSATPVDFDIIGLSFYPAWGDSMDQLKRNMDQLIASYGKDVLICETSYPWKPLGDIHRSVMTWPQTAAGQKQFLEELTKVVREEPGGHGLGYVWWYPEAVPVKGLRIWRDGAEGWFDQNGDLVPAARELGAVGPTR